MALLGLIHAPPLARRLTSSLITSSPPKVVGESGELSARVIVPPFW